CGSRRGRRVCELRSVSRCPARRSRRQSPTGVAPDDGDKHVGGWRRCSPDLHALPLRVNVLKCLLERLGPPPRRLASGQAGRFNKTEVEYRPRPNTVLAAKFAEQRGKVLTPRAVALRTTLSMLP